MPFGLDGKTFVVTVLFMLFLYPWLMGKFHTLTAKKA